MNWFWNKVRLIYETSANSSGASSVNVNLSDCFAVIIVTKSQDTNTVFVSSFIPVETSMAIWSTDQNAVGSYRRIFTVSATQISWTASSNATYPNAFVIPQKIYAIPNRLLQ